MTFFAVMMCNIHVHLLCCHYRISWLSGFMKGFSNYLNIPNAVMVLTSVDESSYYRSQTKVNRYL